MKKKENTMEKHRRFKLVISEGVDKNEGLSRHFPLPRLAPEEHIVCRVGLVSEEALKNSDGRVTGVYKEFEGESPTYE